MNKLYILAALIWILTIFKYSTTGNKKWFLLPVILLVINELFYIILGLEITPAENRTALFYDISMIPTRNGTSMNYSEGYWPDSNYNISPQTAEFNKYDKIIELLGAKQGDLILDMGCGTCSMAEYFKTKGITVEGLTLSDEQVKMCKEKNITAYNKSYRTYHPELNSKYDHIVMMGSSEHIYDGPPHFNNTYIKHNNTFDKILSYCYKYLKQNGNIFYSGLHLNEKYKNTFGMYVLERMYGATLFLNKPGYDIKSSAQRTGYNIKLYEDHTHDYYMATITDKHHFGNTMPLISKSNGFLLFGSVVYPPIIFMWLYYTFGIWMWMFDGNYHTRLIQDSDPKYSFKDIDNRPCTLWWGVFNKTNGR
jgi:cyclopropane fatty-acyl-phospholipid synthase-like methyltransferase